MPYTKDIVEELNILVRYNLATTQEGIKVHKTASPETHTPYGGKRGIFGPRAIR